jgi:dihydropteroate synthase
VSPPFCVMGIVNVTPDSFSDGGEFLDAAAAVAHALELVEEGADILDMGGESTRPGAEPVGAEEELRRVLPVLEGIAAVDWGGTSRGVVPEISIDTSKASVARAAIAAGAGIVNDVTALRGDPEMIGLLAESGVRCCLMHMLGDMRSAHREPRYGDVVDDVRAFLEGRLRVAVEGGVREERIILDPGIGFDKTTLHNLTLLNRLHELTTIGPPVLVGTSRKSFLGRIIAQSRGEDEIVEAPGRLPGTIATNLLAFERGGSVFRVHDVAPVRDALAVAAATLGERWTARSPGTTQRS